MLPPSLAARFSVERVLASGGFGSVFLARQTALDRRVAIKLMHESILEDAVQVERFRLEARITASLDHAHIVRVIDHGVEAGLPWIAYEFLEGRSLADLIAAGSVTPALALRCGAQVASALEVAHAAGVLHRDIKAANVMESAPEHFKVTDFGIARWTTGERVHTKTGTILGTPSHMAPEVIVGEQAGPASDLYALGVLVFEAITGVLPFRAASFAEVLRQHVQEEPPRLASRVNGISGSIDEYVVSLLAKDPRRRPRSAGDVARRLDELAREAVAGRSGGRRVVTGKRPALTARTATLTSPRTVTSFTTAAMDAPRSVRWRAAVAIAAGIALLCGVGWRVMRRPVAVPVASPVLEPSAGPGPSVAPGGPGQDVLAGMVRIQAGVAVIGRDEPGEDHHPERRVKLNAYYIDRFEVSNAAFRTFLGSSQGAAYLAKRVPSLTGQKAGGTEIDDPARGDQPVVWVTRHDATAFCESTGRSLPTEAQWERAARGAHGWAFPWGPRWRRCERAAGKVDIRLLDDYDPAACAVLPPRSTVPHDLALDDRTPAGVLHMLGNVREWVSDAHSATYRAELPVEPMAVDPPGPAPGSFPDAVVKGEGFDNQLRPLWERNNKDPRASNRSIGFRCACPESRVRAADRSRVPSTGEPR